MKKKVYKAFNEQVQAELYSAYMYLAMSLDMEAKNFKGMAHWLKAQYEEEREHAFKLMGFMQDCGEKPELLALAEKDYAAQSHLKWFIDEQVEEEASASEIVEKLQMVGDNVGGLFIIDGQLGARK